MVLKQSQIDWTRYMEGLQGKADRDLSNLNITTNCITEIPQDIKIEISPTYNWKLVLKAGSSVYLHKNNAWEKKVITSDIEGAKDLLTPDASQELFVVYREKDNALISHRVAHTFCQNTPPRADQLLIGFGLWYNTDTQDVKCTTDEGKTWDICSLPICVGNGGFAEIGGWTNRISQVFNGYGYIGACFFVLPGVKGLAPDYRNADGTLRNKELIVKNVLLLVNPHKVPFVSRAFLLNNTEDDVANGLTWIGTQDYFEQDTLPQTSSAYAFWYNTLDNKIYYKDPAHPNWASTYNLVEVCIVNVLGTEKADVQVQPLNTIKVLSQTDKSLIANWAMPSKNKSSLSVSPSGSTYIMPNNGYLSVGFVCSGRSVVGFEAGDTGIYQQIHGNDGEYLGLVRPVRKGESVRIVYGGNSNIWLTFIKAMGEV